MGKTPEPPAAPRPASSGAGRPLQVPTVFSWMPRGSEVRATLEERGRTLSKKLVNNDLPAAVITEAFNWFVHQVDVEAGIQAELGRASVPADREVVEKALRAVLVAAAKGR